LQPVLNRTPEFGGNHDLRFAAEIMIPVAAHYIPDAAFEQIL
jgi:hypothetical protein